MSSDKLPSALSFSQPLASQHSSPRGILNGPSYPKKDSQGLPTPSQNGAPQYSHSTNQFAYSNENTGYMNAPNQPPYGTLDYGAQHHHLSQGQPSTPQTTTSGSGLGSFPQPLTLQPTYSQPSHGFPQFSFPGPNGVNSPAGQPGPMVHTQQPMLPLPQATALNANHSPLSAVSQGGPQTPQSATAGAYSNHNFDATGQVAPPGMKPRVAATLWEDEGSLCFQVEARGVCVARREDNHMINGTKLLNVAGMTRGRRDGILKSEKVRHVVKIGPMHLKGVWIPFERALDFANKEKITELLYPLFVHNIGAFLYHPTNTHRTNAVMAAAERRRADSTVLSHSQALNQGALQRRATTDLVPSSQPPPLSHNGMHNPMSLPPSLAQPRPELQRSISFPTPPSSASSVMGVGGSDSSFWSGNMVSQAGNGALAIDTVMNSARSMPTTPATTPPGGIQQMQQYPSSASSMYPSSQQASMNQQGIAQQNMQRFGQPLPQPSQYMSQNRDNNMGPPTSRGPAPTLSRPASRQDDAHHKEEGSEEQNGLAGEEEYTTHDSNNYNGHRPNGVYYPPLSADPHLSPEMNGSPGQGPSTPARSTYGGPNASVPRTVDGGSGATPRTTTTPQQQWGSGYSTPPRTNSANGSAIRQPPPQRNLYQLVSGDASDQNDAAGAGPQDGNTYAAQSIPMPSQTPPQSYGVNGTATPSSNKRVRDMEDDDEQGSRPASRDHDDRVEPDGVSGMKRRKTIGQASAPVPPPGMATGSFERNAGERLNRTRSAVNPGRVTGRR